MPGEGRTHHIGFRWDQNVSPFLVLHHDTLDPLRNDQLFSPVLQLGLANVNLDLLLQLYEAAIPVVKAFDSKNQPVFMVKENIPDKVLGVNDPIHLYLLEIARTL